MVKLKKYTLTKLKETMSSLDAEDASIILGGGLRYALLNNGTLVVDQVSGDESFIVAENGQKLKLNSELNFGYELSFPTFGGMPCGINVPTGGFKADFNVFKFLASNSNVEWFGNYNTLTGEFYIKTSGRLTSVDPVYDDNYHCAVHSHPKGTGLYYKDNGNPDSNGNPWAFDKDDEASYAAAAAYHNYDTFGLYVPGENNIQDGTNDASLQWNIKQAKKQLENRRKGY